MWFRRYLRQLANTLCVVTAVLGTVFFLLYIHYPKVATDSRAEELRFWSSVDALSAEDHSALLNYVDRTGTVPRILPWWEMDNAMCSATVVKYVALFTGVKLVHASAWTLRTARAKMIDTGEECASCVPNSAKLTPVWDARPQFRADGTVAPGVKQALQDQVRSFPFERDQVYLIGLLWEDTTFWPDIQAAGRDVNSHVALWARGKVIHFIHRKPEEDPLYVESVDALFADGKLIPAWISRVHAKGRDTDLRLPETSRELAFCQQVMPWSTMRYALIFPRRVSLVPAAYSDAADTLVERSMFYWIRGGYDMYPRFAPSEAACAS